MDNSNLKIIENWLEPDLINFLYEKFLYDTPHYYNERSGTDTLFYSHDFNNRDLLLGHLENKLKTDYLTPNHEINRIFFNVQHQGMNGSFHVDFDEKGSVSASLNLSPEDEGGDFVYLENDVEKRVKYKRNSLILFNSTMPHYGEAFKKEPRITLVFHSYVRH
ncbi:uncharacterized protein METZ01_LOCUS179048 [marine metagenome]|jgi:hypothetical protein|uniref:Prolyl 4-hydroxylase alpha subunit Fe(2+) 2OG dioxygenase domain-containing protein n=1 Tax=marine metagenome TaxID=408172 RepID=A0A382CK36_9ZZZZ|tara:strand:+ start:309 stop:797 length:489 start_codon:yes stop_codon:yes gene_type:complete